MDVDDLKSLYLSELQELCDCEARVAWALPVMAASAGSTELRRAEAILRRHGTGPKSGADRVAAALVHKAEQISCLAADPDLRDAALVAAIRRIGHHQIAVYGTVEGYAEALYLGIDRHGLLAILQEKRTAECRFAGLQGPVNQLAPLVSPPSY